MRYVILVSLLAVTISQHLQFVLSGFTSEQIEAVLEIRDRHEAYDWSQQVAVLEEE